jgi:hypothetical protein
VTDALIATHRCRILLQKDMRDTRQSIAFCYLCGKGLPPRGETGRRQQVIGEHVIPRTLLGDAPQSQAEAWAVELDVHRACEQSTKQGADHWLKLLQEMHVKPRAEWGKLGHFRNMPIRPSLVIHRQAGNVVTTLAGLEKLFEGVWRWVRGLHAAVYREFLPSDILHFSYPPVPVCSSQDAGPTIEQTEMQSRLTRSSIDLAESLDKWDGVTAWGGAVRYRCVWWECAALKGKPNWICFWTLSFPCLEEWSRQVLPRGSERPWHGNYVCATRPDNAAWLKSEDFPKENGSEVQA